MRKCPYRLVAVAAALSALATTMPASAGTTAHEVVVSPHPAGRTPQVLDGEVKAIAKVGDRMVVGGSFGRVREADGGVVVERRNLFAFDPRTGAIYRDFAPDVDGRVEALAAAPGNQAVFAGGRFDTVDGRPLPRLAKLDIGDGRPSGGFATLVTGSSVEDLAVSGDRLFVGGGFVAVNGQPRLNLAAVDTGRGDVDPGVDVPFTVPREGRLRVEKLAVGLGGDRLVAIGNFTRVAGQERQQIAVVDLRPGGARLAGWHTGRYADVCQSKFDTYMRDVDVAPDGSWFVVVTTGARSRPTLCDTAARFELDADGRNLEPTWVDSSGGDSFTGVAVTGEAVYVGGHMRWMNNPYNRDTGKDARPGPGAVPRSGIAALDPENGLPLSWDPGRDPRGQGAFALVPTGDGLWVGSDTDRIDGEFRPRLALLPVDGGRPVPRPQPAALPGDLYSVGERLVRRRFDGRTLGPPSNPVADLDWSRVRGAFALGGVLYTGWEDGHLDARPFGARLFDASQPGEVRDIPLRGLSPGRFPVPRLTGMFYDAGRLYYTVSGDRRLYGRWFSPESGVVGSDVFVAGGRGDGLDWSGARGLTLAGGRIFHVTADGHLRATEFRRGRPVPGTTSTVAGGVPPGRGLFILGS